MVFDKYHRRVDVTRGFVPFIFRVDGSREVDRSNHSHDTRFHDRHRERRSGTLGE